MKKKNECYNALYTTKENCENNDIYIMLLTIIDQVFS